MCLSPIIRRSHSDSSETGCDYNPDEITWDYKCNYSHIAAVYSMREMAAFFTSHPAWLKGHRGHLGGKFGTAIHIYPYPKRLKAFSERKKGWTIISLYKQHLQTGICGSSNSPHFKEATFHVWWSSMEVLTSSLPHPSCLVGFTEREGKILRLSAQHSEHFVGFKTPRLSWTGKRAEIRGEEGEGIAKSVSSYRKLDARVVWSPNFTFLRCCIFHCFI